MKKVIILVTLFLVGFAVGIGVHFISNSDESSKTLELTYNTNGGVPYEWKYEIEDSSIVKFVKSYVVEDKNKDGMVGAPISTNYVFKGLKKGKTTITFKYVSMTDGTVDKEEKVTIKVDKNKNISLVGK